jgi:diguanylate cyclase (GGDEF)-like protein/PAS domain S-box-containing protein
LDVLLVDADHARAGRMASQLADRGHTVTPIRSTAEALGHVGDRARPLLLVAPRLPDGDGLALCRRIRDERGRKAGIVVLADAADPGSVLAALDAGADSFIAPPYDPAHLVGRLRAARAHSRSDEDDGAVTLREFLRASLESPAARPAGPPAEARCPVAQRAGLDHELCALRIALMGRIFESAADGIVVTDPNGTIVDASAAFCATSGYARAELVGQNPRLMKSDRHDAGFYRRMWQRLLETGTWQGEVWDRRKNGEVYPKWLTISALRDGDGRVTHYVGISSDITGAKRSEQELERLAHYDALTGLPNRILFRDRLQQALNQAERGGAMVAVLFLDLDGFKAVNTDLGHRSGDLLLAAVGRRLASCIRASDTIARHGGDEFVIVLPDVVDPDTAGVVARKILDSFAQPFELEEHEVRVSTSVGIALYPQDAREIDELVKDADEAMYQAKELGRGTSRFFSGETQKKAQQRLALEAELRRAIERNELVLHYQPRIDLRTGAIVGVEALVRWMHPREGMIPPGRFIPIAEQSRLIARIDDWVLRAACRQQRAWQDDGLPEIRMAVNLSASQFETKDLPARVARLLIDTGVPPRTFELELTESTAMDNPDGAVGTLLELKSIGVHASIDDFGTGYSSLAYLKRFPIDALKIDRSFVRDLGSDPDDAAIATAVIRVGHSLGLQVIAEGVETREQLGFLRDNDCDEIQGFLASRPVPPETIAGYLAGARKLLPE